MPSATLSDGCVVKDRKEKEKQEEEEEEQEEEEEEEEEENQKRKGYSSLVLNKPIKRPRLI